MLQSTTTLEKEKVIINDLRSLVDNDWKAMDQEIQNQLDSDIGLINSISHYIINSGGKRLRPLIVLIACNACGFMANREKNIKAAAMIEFIHTATLLHDDVVDDSDTRRGSITAHRSFGNESTILVGDFLYSRAFQIMVEIGHMRIMEIMSDATNTIAEGEVLQLIHCGNPDTTEKQYMDVIYRKTAKLFESATTIGAVLSDQSKLVEDCLRTYGKELGIAYQLIDDVLDYSSSSEIIGKDIGDDLSEGKPTLPLIYALERCNPNMQLMIREAITNKDSSHSKEIFQCVIDTGSLALTAEQAQIASKRAIDALNDLPNNQFKDALIQLAKYTIERIY